tara:strand:+ start:371 stop:712 length:342 start_codon:yes stop_codon:yes gene_type:complete
MKAANLLLLLIGLLFLCFGICFGQVSVVHFNSEWNSDNDFDISELKDCESSNVIICHNEDLKEKHKIKSVPTIIVFDNNIEIERFEANIMMELEATLDDIQGKIDNVYLAKFE